MTLAFAYMSLLVPQMYSCLRIVARCCCCSWLLQYSVVPWHRAMSHDLQFNSNQLLRLRLAIAKF